MAGPTTPRAVRKPAAKPRTAAPEQAAEVLEEVPGGALVLQPEVVTFARQVLFEFNGRKWTCPVDFDRSTALEYLHLARKQGMDVAVDFALETALGAEDYAAFRRIKGLSQDQMDWIIGVVCGRVAGAGGNVPK